MAFRKKTYPVYRSSVSGTGSFGEREYVTSTSEDGRVLASVEFVRPDNLSKRSIDPNLFSSKKVLESGEVIKGSTSYAPTDPDTVERSVELGISNYISNNPVSNPQSND